MYQSKSNINILVAKSTFPTGMDRRTSNQSVPNKMPCVTNVLDISIKPTPLYSPSSPPSIMSIFYPSSTVINKISLFVGVTYSSADC